MPRVLLVLFFIFLAISNFGANRSIWVTAWDLTSTQSIDEMLKKVSKHGFNKVFVQTRYRGDALYVPNKKDSTFLNPDKRCYLISGTDFDPLQYTIDKAKEYQIEVHAWVTVFVSTPHDLSKISPQHHYYTHPEWLLKDRSGKTIPNDNYEGAFLDPAIPEVRDYLLNVFCDIASNYEISGIQLDYIRYPDSIYGYNTYAQDSTISSSTDFLKWRQQKISSFVNASYIKLKVIKPQLEVSAAVIADPIKAYNSYSQNWANWLSEGYIDRVYVMAYNTYNSSFQQTLNYLNRQQHKEKISIIVRAWQEDKPYPVSKINEKLVMIKASKFRDIGYYNYSGMLKNKYFEHINFL